jgi:hypothetical protein
MSAVSAIMRECPNEIGARPAPDWRNVSGVTVQQGYHAAAQTVLGALERLPGAVVGVVLISAAADLFGPTWGGAVMFAWLTVAAVTLTRAGERSVARGPLRYRPVSEESWLAKQVRQDLDTSRVDLYIAPHAVGVFPLGHRTIAIGERSVGDGQPTLQLHAQTAEAVRDLRAGRTRAELAVMWCAAPLALAKMAIATFLPKRLHTAAAVLYLLMLLEVLVASIMRGRLLTAGLAGCVLTDWTTAHLRMRFARVRARDSVRLRPAR